MMEREMMMEREVMEREKERWWREREREMI